MPDRRTSEPTLLERFARPRAFGTLAVAVVFIFFLIGLIMGRGLV